ncbi:MAG TPA: DnaJ family domain-containing protein [Candidatus Binatia bacterium]|nr:DnaJ family domain-containing protein [Candidatus Binatia bacterium]
MRLLQGIAEARIREAIARGELDDLPGRGKRLELEDLSQVPEDLRGGYLLLKNAGVLPEEMQVRKEMVTLEALLDACADPEERTRLRKELNWKIVRFQVLMERRRPGALPPEYRRKLVAKLVRS